MNILIHDLEKQDFINTPKKLLDNSLVISNEHNINNCIGCFGCWIKTPGACVIKDEYNKMGEYLSKCSTITIISKCFYGSFSPFIKNVLDRSISYVHPYFVTRGGQMHHKRRYNNNIQIKVCFYGESITNKEKETAKDLVKANALNLDCEVKDVLFLDSILEAKELII